MNAIECPKRNLKKSKNRHKVCIQGVGVSFGFNDHYPAQQVSFFIFWFSMFSSRTNWNATPNRLTRLLEMKRLQGETIIDLTESNPTLCGFSYPDQDILAALTDPSILVYHPEPRGLLSARRAIAEYYSTLNVSVDPDHIVLTASTSEAYTFILRLLCDIGDEVIVPRPSYPLFEYLCQLTDVKLRQFRLAYDGEWHIDFESLQTELNQRTRVIVLVHPNNPTGSYLKQDEFDRVCRIAVEHTCAVIVDEVFGPFTSEHDSRRAKILSGNQEGLILSLNGISKLMGLPQFKLSWIAVAGTIAQVQEALKRLEVVADTYLSVNTPIQVALPKLFQHLPNTIEEIRTRILKHYELVRKVFAGSRVSVYRMEGGWYTILQFPKSKSDDEWVGDLLAHRNILLYPGHFFNFERDSCLVISLLPPTNLFESALLNIRGFIEES